MRRLRENANKLRNHLQSIVSRLRGYAGTLHGPQNDDMRQAANLIEAYIDRGPTSADFADKIMRIESLLPVPDETRKAVYARADSYCEDCGTDTEELELHHRWYERQPDVVLTKHDMYPESVLGKETPDDLMALCRHCHLSRHVDDVTDEFYARPDELEDERAYRDHMSR